MLSKIYRCYDCQQVNKRSDLVKINVAEEKDEFGLVSGEQYELVCRSCQRSRELAVFDTME